MAKQHHIGRLIDHVHLRARDLEAMKRFYKAVLEALGIPVGTESPKHVSFDELWIDALGDEKKSATHVHLAFQAGDREAMARFHAAAVAAGAATTANPGNAVTTPATTPHSS
jgi:catechol 2,3-dioxygenase-like lactoylglutathione lyase family enzyme